MTSKMLYTATLVVVGVFGLSIGVSFSDVIAGVTLCATQFILLELVSIRQEMKK